MRLRDHLGKLVYFCSIAENGSLKKASEDVLVGQPQLTKVIKQLEDVLGTQLLVRSNRGVSLTLEGQLLYDSAKKMLEEVDQVEFQIKSKEQKYKGSIQIGTYDSISRYFFPSFLKYLKQTAPGIKVYLETGRSQDMLNKLQKDHLDLAVVVADSKLSKELIHEPIYSDSFGLYQAPSADQDFIDSFIYFPFGETEENLQRKYKFNQSIRCDNLETVRSLTEQGLGVGLLPHLVAREALLARKIVPFEKIQKKDNSFDLHNIVLSYQKDEESELVVFIKDEIKRFLQLWSK